MSKNVSAKYYQVNKERLQKRARENYQNVSKEEIEKNRKYGRKRFENLSEDEKQNLVEYRKKYYRMRENAFSELCETIILKNNDLESSFYEAYKNVYKL